jgi:GNAT superfamily N-acetyltransferase
VITIRLATELDHDAVWDIFQSVVEPGDCFAFDPRTSSEEALAYWFREDTKTYVAEASGTVVGTYLLRANQPGLGDHVANGAFMVSPTARGRGVGKRMGEHALAEARRFGFRAMQFNFVVSRYKPALRLWEKLAFRIVGTLPCAFRHAEYGFVDAHVMFRTLDDVPR